MTTTKMLSLLLVLAFAGCAVDADAPTDDATAAEARSSVPSVYLLARADQRKCVSPLCGGLWVRRVNFDTTRCADGSYQPECYVAQASFDALRFDDGERASFEARLREGHALVRAKVAAKTYGDFGNLGVLKVSEAWDAWTDQAIVGMLHAVGPTGIVCISAPCPTLHATQLNRTREDLQVTDLVLDALYAAEETKLEMWNLAYEGALLVAGEIETCDSTHASVLSASQVFKKVEHKVVVDVTGDWTFVAGDRSHYDYSFAADGTFKATQQPGCLFARPACAVKMALLEGTYVVEGTALHIVYTSAVRNGERADFVAVGEGASMRLEGEDFGTSLKLRRAR